MLPNNDPTLLNNDVSIFQINTTICTSMLPANFNEREERRTKQKPKATQRPSSIDENVFPDLLCGLVCFENCGLALTKNKHVVAWSLCKPPAIEIIDERVGDVETKVKKPSPPPKPTLTVDLKSMVDAGIITEEQAYGMMGIDPVSTSEAKEDSSIDTDNNSEEGKNGDANNEEAILSFVITPQPLIASDPVSIKFIQTFNEW